MNYERRTINFHTKNQYADNDVYEIMNIRGLRSIKLQSLNAIHQNDCRGNANKRNFHFVYRTGDFLSIALIAHRNPGI